MTHSKPSLSCLAIGVAVWLITAGAASAELVFDPAVNYGVGDAPLSVAIGDLNGDSLPDLATANVNSDDVAVLLNRTEPPVGGAVTGVTPRVVSCENLTTKQRIRARTRDTSWDCEALGLVAESGDRVSTGVSGTAK